MRIKARESLGDWFRAEPVLRRVISEEVCDKRLCAFKKEKQLMIVMYFEAWVIGRPVKAFAELYLFLGEA